MASKASQSSKSSKASNPEIKIRRSAIDVDMNVDNSDRSQTRHRPTIRHLQIFDPRTPLAVQKFVPDRVVATPGAIALLMEHHVDMLSLIGHHLRGDWGDSDSDEITLNDFAVANELRVMSTFRIADWRTQRAMSAQDRAELPTVWIITEHDRSVTTVMLPSEY